MRQCKTCHACCTHLSIDELGKAAHVRCQYLKPSGCRRYNERPETCRDFMCLWRTGGFSQAMRPDKCGVLIHVARNEIGGTGINVVECEAGALDREVHLVDAVLSIECVLVTCRYRDGRLRLYSKDARWIDDVRRRNPALQLPEDISALDMMVMMDDEPTSLNEVSSAGRLAASARAYEPNE